jgi:signal recognition particle subunit SRP54
VPVFSEATDPVAVAAAAIAEARSTGRDIVIVDTAGRLAIDAELMDEVRRISEAVDPEYTFLVIDAMTGQDAVSTAEAFHQALELDGVILTKLDGDARGGAALSVKEVVGRPIAFASTGEKLGDFDLFHPDRLAGRILGMGDVLTLIEKAEEVFEKDEAEAAAARLMEGQFTFDDFLDQMQQLKKMGPLKGVLGMMPGVPKEVRDADIDDREIGRIEAMIRSMTAAERRDPDLIDQSRRIRIAKGSGTEPGQVGDLVKQFKEVSKMMKRMGGMGTKRLQKSRRKAAKGKKGKGKGPSGGRVSPKGGARKAPLRLPNLDAGGGGGLPGKGGLPDLSELGLGEVGRDR